MCVCVSEGPKKETPSKQRESERGVKIGALLIKHVYSEGATGI